MADYGVLLHFLILMFTLRYHALGVLSETVHDVAQKQLTWQSSFVTTGNSSYAVDNDLSTCMRTQEEKGASLGIDLGTERTITGVELNGGFESLVFMHIFITRERTSEPNYSDLCATQRSETDITFKAIRCHFPKSGRYIIIKSRFKSVLALCDVKVYECVDGYFGKDCDKPCHCIEGDECDKGSGRCPISCGLGWKGDSCQEECEEGEFGPGCAQRCHCLESQPCDKSEGQCPGQCDRKWVGPTCQTEIPILLTEPVLLSKTPHSITLRWDKWNGPIDAELEVLFVVQCKLHEYHQKDAQWQSCAEAVQSRDMNPQDTFMRVEVLNLTTSSFYMFRIVPYISGSEGRIQGTTSQISAPLKTECAPPEPPFIEKVEPSVDSQHNPPKAQIVVRWKGLEQEQVNCDSIKFYRIQYQIKDSPYWDTVVASNRADMKNITRNVQFNNIYRVKVVAVNNQDYNGISRMVEVSTKTTGEKDPWPLPMVDQGRSSSGLIAGIIIAIMVALAACIALFLYRRHHQREKYSSVPVKEDQNLEDGQLLNNFVKVEVTQDHSPTDMDSGIAVNGSASENTPSSNADTLDSLSDEKPKFLEKPPDIIRIVKIEELENYVMERREKDCEGLRQEYEEIPMGFTTKCDCGRRPENRHKNRFINIIAYDHSRMILEKVEGDPDSDYINANYIDGYHKPREYIAAQGTNKYTIQDMWRMVWQEHSGRIVMATNLIENGKRKCDQYWPELGDTKIYREIEVTLTDVEPTSDFITRTFKVKFNDEEREVKQFHFIAWPDHGVPTRASPIIAFRRKVRSYDETHPGTIVVHCSAGVGRTGTYIALDYLLDKAKEEGVIDVYGLTYQMRRDRVNMIQTVEQYIFVYDALLEALKAGETNMACSEFRELYEKLCEVDPEKEKSKLQQQFANLQCMSPKVKIEDCKSAMMAENLVKNRCEDILPADRHRPYLMIRVDGTNDYINAVFLDGFKKRNAYIISQMPMPHTVIDFWRMVYEHGCASIVMLNPMDDNDETYGQYWLEEEGCECGPFVIEPVSADITNPDITIREIKLTYEPQSPSVLPSKKEEKPRVISQFQLNSWVKDADTPNSKTSLIQLIEAVERWQQKTGDGPIVVHCHDGVKASGLYAAVSCIWEKMKVDQEVDIFHSVKHLRYHQPQVINSMEQYVFCYEMVLAYLAEFETYSNFR